MSNPVMLMCCIYRPLQEQEVQVQYLSCPGSADDMIWSIVNSKLQVVGSTLDGHTAGTAAGVFSTSVSVQRYQLRLIVLPATACHFHRNVCDLELSLLSARQMWDHNPIGRFTGVQG